MKQPKQGWTEDFDEKFVSRSTQGYDNTPFIIKNANEVKVFISSLLLSQRKEVIEEIIEEIRSRLVAESTIGEHTMVVFDDIIKKLTNTPSPAIKGYF